ncbi:hypothetical protein EJ08DRAFT_678095 [Tothia fuscella]|uniref:Uncharacterized protein n=1 Tax=Tothia fuscella TaxID=1048955 RepID=A0A9P4TYZ6_9PEZI|nr:hypothetical protein EJ08DRAFT_678095 [Tothia fuscella]
MSKFPLILIYVTDIQIVALVTSNATARNALTTNLQASAQSTTLQQALPSTNVQLPLGKKRKNDAPQSARTKRKRAEPKSTSPIPPSLILTIDGKSPGGVELPTELWWKALDYLSPERMLLLIKTVPRGTRFHDILTGNFKLYRKGALGADVPDCPDGMREEKYLELLVGTECMSCGNPSVLHTITFWDFQKRLCFACQGLNDSSIVIYEKAMAIMHEGQVDDSDLLRCIPSNSAHSYYCDHQYEDPRNQSYLKSDVESIVKDYNSFLAVHDHNWLYEWKKELKKQCLDRKKHLLEVKKWHANYKREQTAKAEEEKQAAILRKVTMMEAAKVERGDEIIRKVVLMDPTIKPAAVYLCRSFQLSTRHPKPLADKGWERLWPKLEAEIVQMKRTYADTPYYRLYFGQDSVEGSEAANPQDHSGGVGEYAHETHGAVIHEEVNEDQSHELEDETDIGTLEDEHAPCIENSNDNSSSLPDWNLYSDEDLSHVLRLSPHEIILLRSSTRGKE